jgi:hypothetical protein
MREIPLTKGFVAQIDDADFERVSKNKWSALVDKRHDTVYAQRQIRLANGKLTSVMLHRFILSITDPELDVDHEDHDGLNCQRYNLRPATRPQNMHNQRKQQGCTSKYKGVDWFKRNGTWRVRIKLEHKRLCLGHYPTEEEAAHVYDAAAREYFGEFALTNF